MTNVMDNQNYNPDLTRGILQRFAQVIITLLVQAAILFIAAGTLRWWEAWALLGVYAVLIAINGVFLLRANPETIAERGQAAESGNWQAWDKVVGLLFALFYFVGILLVAGLDQRFSWTGRTVLWLRLGGLALFAAGLGLFSWAMVTNAYFSTAVRIQDDRGQTVCTSGPYRAVRHPGYVGAIVQSVGMALALGSLWALLPAGLAAASLVVRTTLEDRTLQRELPGYKAYTEQVRYKLVPGLW